MAKKPLYGWGDGNGKKHTISKAQHDKNVKARQAPKPAAVPLYDWGDGHGKVHTIAKVTHDQNVQAAPYGIDLDAPSSTPLTNRQAFGIAEANAGREYDPQIKAAQQTGRNVEPWFQNYINRTTAQQGAAQQYASQVLAPAQAWASAAPQAAPGLNPGSAAYGQSQQAASSGQGLAQLGYATEAAIPLATDGYLAGQANIAAQQIPQLQQSYATKVGDLKGQRGQATASEYGKVRTNEQNANIAYETLGLQGQKAAIDAANDAASAAAKAAAAKAKARAAENKPTTTGPFAGLTPKQIRALPTSVKTSMRNAAKTPEKPYSSGPFAGATPSEVARHSQTWVKRQVAAYNATKHTGKSQAEKDAEKQAADDKKHKTAVRKATGNVRVSVENTITKWNGYVGQQTDDTTKPKRADGTYPPRNLTPSDIKRILGAKTDAGLIHVALLVRTGKPLDKAAIDYLHSKDPNIRIPKEWLRGKTKPTSRPSTPTHPLAPDGNGQMRPN